MKIWYDDNVNQALQFFYEEREVIMGEMSIQFKNQWQGYDKEEVDQFVKDAETMLQEKALELAKLHQQVEELEARLNKIIGTDASAEEKIALYDQLMKKMEGDYTNLLSPAVAKAKALEQKARKEYEIRMDQARYAAEGIYEETVQRISDAADAHLDRMFDLMDRYVSMKAQPGYLDRFLMKCKKIGIALCDEVNEKKPAVVRGVKRTKRRVKRVARRTCAKVKCEAQKVSDVIVAKLPNRAHTSD